MRPLLIALFAVACGGGDGDPSTFDPPELRPPPDTNWGRDILSTSLQLDLSQRTGIARIEVAPSESRALSLEVGDLRLIDVRDDAGPLDYVHDLSRLDVGVPMTGAANVVTIEYEFFEHDRFQGASAKGWTLTWPHYCGNLFPCKSDPSDGTTFALELTGVPEGSTAVYPQAITTEAPAYMLAWSVGDYSYASRGTTPSGTEVGFFYQAGGESAGLAGTDDLIAVFGWLEGTFGPYPFGDRVAAVATEWGFGQFGGMEHHPYWHVAIAAMGSHETQVHEAAHGWFGNGVRIACWEDFVLSEGPTTYLAARATEAAIGSEAADAIWQSYRDELPSTEGLLVWPQGCGEIDVIADQLFTRAPYIRGAFFLRAVAEVVGAGALDDALASFVTERIGTAATFQQLLDHIESSTGFDPQDCAEAWLRADSLPASESCE